MAKIIGNTTATPNPRPDWTQTDENKADYIKNKPENLPNPYALTFTGAATGTYDGSEATTINIPVNDGAGQVALHNEDPLAHADIRSEISQLSSEKVDIEMLFDLSASNYADMSTLINGMLHKDGKIYTGSSYANYCYLESYIPVTQGEVLTIQYTMSGTRYWSANKQHSSGAFARIAAYDNSQNVVSSAGAESLSGNVVYSYTVPSGISFVRITFFKSLLDRAIDIAILKNASAIVEYAEYGKLSFSTIKQQYIPNTSNEIINANDIVYAAIPKTIHIAVGKEFRMYYNNILSRYTDRLWIGNTSDITVKRYSKYLSITATKSISKSINWKIYDDSFNVVKSGTITVVATDDINKKSTVLVIGDSTVTQSNAISQKLLDCYSASSGNLILLGTRGSSPALHEGRAGWTSTQYCTVASNGSVTNPFYNNGFDFSYYMTQQGYSGVDVVVIQLGINDIFSMTHENFNETPTLNNLNTMIMSILAYNSNIKIVVNLISVPNGNGTAFTDTYNTSQIDFVYLVNTIRLSNALIEHFKDNISVTISPNNCVLDATTDLNDGVHPNANGYAKLGQTIYETINGIYEATDDDNEEDEPVQSNELWDAGSRTAQIKSYAAATGTRTISNDYYYYPAAYTGAWSNNYEMTNVEVGSNTLQFSAPASAFGIFVPFIELDSTKTYRFTVNPTVAGFRVYLVNYDSTGVYVDNQLIVDKTTGKTTFEFIPTSGYQQGFCFACLSGTKDTVGVFTELSLVEIVE